MSITDPKRLENCARRDLWVVVPAFHEESVIGEVVSCLLEKFEHVVVIDDGSEDATADRAKESGALVLRHVVNSGQGASLQTGIKYACSNGAQYIATFDADGQHNPDDLSTMFDVLISNPCDIVLGSRFLGQQTSHIPLARRILLRMAVLFTRLTTGVKLTDAHNGLRVMTCEACHRICIKQSGMAHASELISIIKRERMRVKEVCVTIAYTEYSISKGQRFVSAFGIIKEMFVGKFIK